MAITEAVVSLLFLFCSKGPVGLNAILLNAMTPFIAGAV
jgi:hypothetical protein